MTEYDYWNLPENAQKSYHGDITVRDGFQHLEKFISTPAKITILEERFCRCRNIEVNNLVIPETCPSLPMPKNCLAHLRLDSFASWPPKRH